MTFGKLLIRNSFISTAAACAFALGTPAAASTIYLNGFETNTAGWQDLDRVASGNGGISSSSGGFHAIATNGDFTQFGGYNYGAGNVATTFQEYWTSVDIYLDVAGGWNNNTRFDFSSAVSNALGGHRRDFVFNGGFYNDATGPDAGTNRFVISASTNSQPGSAFAKNPDKGPIAISTSGWYTFEHHFYDNGGFLAVDMSILDASNALVHTWTLSDAADLIGSVGGSRYGWFDYSQFSGLAIDNTELRLADANVPVPGSLALLGLGVAGLGWTRRKQA